MNIRNPLQHFLDAILFQRPHAVAQRFAGAEIDEEREAERMRQVFGQ